MATEIVIAHDVGTSGVKSALVNSKGEIICHATHPYPMFTPQPGWVEQDPLDYWNAIVANTKILLKATNPDEIAGLVFTTQSMGIIPVDEIGTVLRRNITWVDGRAEEQARWLMNLFGGRTAFKSFLGIEITGKDVIPKLRWLKQNEPDIYSKTYKVLDVNGYLRFKATGNMAAEWSGASSWGFNVKKKDWEHLFFMAAGFDRQKLPELIRSTDIAGALTKEAAKEMGLNQGIPVFGGCDDSQSAAVGAGCVAEGSVFAYLGTAAQLGVTTAKAVKFKNGAACIQGADPKMNLLIGVTETAGNNVEWLIQNFYKKELEEFGKEKMYELLTEEVKVVQAGADELIFTPWFLGERCPVSTTTTRGTMFNLGMEHTRGHIARALFEGIGYNLRWIIENYEKDFRLNIPEFRFIGGGSQNKTWMQAVADITGRKIITTNYPTMAGALGAAMCAFVGAGIYADFSEIDRIVITKETFLPNAENKATYDKLFVNYKNVYRSLKATYHKANYDRFNTAN
ncbi:xylulokinase [Maribellus sediminis]|uniref:xylulokinase n=1 Tax=Maribellus sediminis TaxID=2696285 RepID=UPI0014304AA4|nr:FGGY-family carbohydrate kinase [Maribellus sediminis]